VALRFPADAPFDIVALTTDQVRARAPHEVAKPETMNYRTMAPEPGGFFDPKLFGPGTVIDAPVPNADDLIKPRRTHFARLPLATPMAHPLLVAHAAAQLGELAGLAAADVTKAAIDFEAGRALATALADKAPWAVVHEIPMLPPDLRPLRLDEHMRWAMTPINTWYQRILNKTTRLKKLIEQGAPAVASLNNDWAELDAAWRGLAENDESASPALDPQGDALPSLRTLARGTDKLYATLREIATDNSPAGETTPASHYIAQSVLFALGFQLGPDRA
jgi:DNA-directed RNA polymerase beta' subunit